MTTTLKAALAAILMLLCVPVGAGAASRIKDLANIEGVRQNQLIGYGIVVGLDGTGDNSQVKFSGQSVANMLKQFGLKMPERTDTKVKNVAAVMITANLAPFAAQGSRMDVTVSAMGDAKSLQGGALLATPPGFGVVDGDDVAAPAPTEHAAQVLGTDDDVPGVAARHAQLPVDR